MERGRALRRVLLGLSALMLSAVFGPGCLLVVTTEHRIKLNDNGSGEGRLILTDIRSDGTTDSARAADLALLVSIHDSAAGAQFERRGRTLTQRRLFTHGDTLSGEIFYTFRTPLAVDGLAWTREGFSIVIPAGADIVKTNGEVEDWLGGAKRIRWDLDARRLMYRVCERQVRPSVSLSALYRDRIHH